MNYWVWVFGEADALDWVRGNEIMAFPSHADREMAQLREGDRAVLYTTRGAFHNPTRDDSRFVGVATVASPPARQERTVVVGGREFTWTCDVKFDLLLPRREGPAVRELAPRLELVEKPEVWGQYFRRSPIRVSEHDFELMRDAVVAFSCSIGSKEH